MRQEFRTLITFLGCLGTVPQTECGPMILLSDHNALILCPFFFLLDGTCTITTTRASERTMITPPQSPSLGSTDGDERVVRFDNECVLIPESVLCSKRPKVFTKTYSLPLWKRKPAPAPDTDVSYAESGTNEENQVVFKVPVPRYVRSLVSCHLQS